MERARAQELETQAIPDRAGAAAAPVHHLLSLQRSAGNAAVTALLAGQRRHVARTLPEARVAGAPDAAPVTGRVIAIAAPFLGTPQSADAWSMIQSQFAKPRANPRRRLRAGHALKPLQDELHSSTTVAELSALDASARRTALTEMFNRLTPAVAPRGADGSDPDLAAELAAEEPLVDARIIDNAVGGWRGVREGVLGAFGVFEFGAEVAIQRANAYYRQLRPARLHGHTGSLVHPDTQAALDRATTILEAAPAAEQPEISASIGTPQGFTIRPNANNAWVLSFHSFGWAIDLSPTTNPNVGEDGPALDAVAAVTGRADPRAAETEGLSAADAQRVAEELRATSRSYVDAMRDDASIGAALRAIANRARAAETLPELAGDGSDILAAAGGGTNAQLNAVLAVIAADAPTPRPERLTTAARSILSAVLAYRQSFRAGGSRTRASVTASRGSVAAHGFMSLHPRLVGALAGTDGGNLNWLGTSSVNDYMHFELPRAARRDLLDVAPATGAGEPHTGAEGPAPAPAAAAPPADAAVAGEPALV